MAQEVKEAKAKAKEEAQASKAAEAAAAKISKAEAKATEQSARRRKDSLSKSWKLFTSVLGSMRWSRYPLLVLALLAVFRGNAETLQHLSRAVGASAAVTVAFSDLAVQVLNSTSSGFALASTKLWGVTFSSLGTLEASWRGVDLVNVSITRSRGRLQASHPAVLRAWLLSPEGKRITVCNSSEAQQVWLDAVASLHSGLPGVHHERDALQLQGEFERVPVQLNWTGQ